MIKLLVESKGYRSVAEVFAIVNLEGREYIIILALTFRGGCIMRDRLSNMDFLLHLQAVTPRRGDSVKELRDKTKDLTLDEFLEMVRKVEDELLKRDGLK